MSYSPPDSGWMIQDLDMMYPPQDRHPTFSIKSEPDIDRNMLPVASTGVPGASNYSYSCQNNSYAGEWPADLDNIHLDCSLPTEAESPLKLEDYNITKFVFVDPSTQSPSPNVQCSNPYNQSSMCSQMKYSTPLPNAANLIQRNSQPNYYEQPSMFTMETMPPEVTPIVHDMPGDCQSRTPGRRGRPRAEWRINKRGPGRPRAKPGRKPTLGVIKTEPEDDDDDENMYPDEEKRERRREQNRRAARKLREKKKVHVEHMKKNYEHILSENRRLSSEVAKLKQLVTELKTAERNHVCVWNDAYTASPASVTSQATSAYVSGSDSGGSYHEVMTSQNRPSSGGSLMSEMTSTGR